MVAVELSTAYSAGSAPKHSNQLHQFLEDKSFQNVDIARSPVQAAPENGNVGLPRKVRNREVTSRYKSATVSSSATATAVASAQRRFPSPILVRTPSPCLERRANATESSVLKRAAERRSISVERHRPLASSMIDTKNTAENAKFSSRIRPISRALDSLWPSTNTVFSSMQSDPSSGASPNAAAIDGKWRQHFQSSDHPLKPTANGLHPASDATLGHLPVRTQQRRGNHERNATPERRTPLCRQVENAKLSGAPNRKPDQQRLPGMGTQKLFGPGMSRSMDLTLQKESSICHLIPSRHGIANSKGAKSVPPTRNLSLSVNDGPAASATNRNVVRRISLSNQKSSDHDLSGLQDRNAGIADLEDRVGASVEEREIGNTLDGNVSDTDSISSSGSAAQSVSSGGGGSRGPGRGTVVPARFWQDMASRLRRFPDNGRTLS
eukprot:c34804_g1_i1 orf=2-1309(-)